jgi:hypothetical protein
MLPLHKKLEMQVQGEPLLVCDGQNALVHFPL